MSEAFLHGTDGTDGSGSGGKRLSSQLLHKNKSPWQCFTFLLLAFFGHGPDGIPSQRGIITTANRVTPTGKLSKLPTELTRNRRTVINVALFTLSNKLTNVQE